MFALSKKRYDMSESYSIFNVKDIVDYADLLEYLNLLMDDKVYKFGESIRRDLSKDELRNIIEMKSFDVERCNDRKAWSLKQCLEDLLDNYESNEKIYLIDYRYLYKG